jgi:hypothetical protein
MMCNTCKKAGQLLTIGMVDMSAEVHESCEYADCTCEHQTVSVLKDSQVTGRPSS